MAWKLVPFGEILKLLHGMYIDVEQADGLERIIVVTDGAVRHTIKVSINKHTFDPEWFIEEE